MQTIKEIINKSNNALPPTYGNKCKVLLGILLVLLTLFLIVIIFREVGVLGCIIGIKNDAFNPCYSENRFVPINEVQEVYICFIGFSIIAISLIFLLVFSEFVYFSTCFYILFVYTHIETLHESKLNEFMEKNNLEIYGIGLFSGMIWSDLVSSETYRYYMTEKHISFKCLFWNALSLILSIFLLIESYISIALISLIMFPILADILWDIISDIFTKKYNRIYTSREMKLNYLFFVVLISIGIIIMKYICYYTGYLECKYDFIVNPCENNDKLITIDKVKENEIYVSGFLTILFTLLYLTFTILLSVLYFYAYRNIYDYDKVFPNNTLRGDIEKQENAEIVNIMSDRSRTALVTLRRKNISRKIIFLITIAYIISHVIAFKYKIIYGILFYILFPIVSDVTINSIIYLWNVLYNLTYYVDNKE